MVACILCHFLAVPCVGQLSVNVAYPGQIHLFVLHLYPFTRAVLSDFINLTQVHNFTVSAQDIFTFRCISVSIVSFTGILQVLTNVDNETFCTVLLTSQVVLVESLQLKGLEFESTEVLVFLLLVFSPFYSIRLPSLL